MADNESIVKIKTVADNSGAESAQKANDRVGDSAKKVADASSQSASKAAGVWQRFSGAVSSVGRAVGTVTRALGFVGLAMNAIETIVDWYQKLKEWLDRDRKAAEELSRAVQDGNIKAAVEASAAAYEKLNAKLAETLRLTQEIDRLSDRRLNQERAIEDAQTELDMQRELAGLDRNDPDYQQNAELVRSKYARVRADRAAERARQDNRIAQGRRYEQAAEKEKAADAIEKVVYGSAGDAVITLKGQIHDEKDPERKKQKESELENLVAAQKKRLDAAKKLRDEATSLRKEAENELGAYMAAKITAEAANVAQDAADADTRRQMDQNRAAREKAAKEKKRKEDEAAAQKVADEKTVAEGKEQLSRYEEQEKTEEARAQAAAEAYAKEQGDVVVAQNRYDMLVQNGGSKKERSAALAALQKEKDEALEAQHEMEKVAAEVANVLKAIKDEVGTLSRSVKAAQSRLKQNEADAPEG